MIAETATRVQQHTAPRVNEHIQRKMRERVCELGGYDRASAIARRLHELDREWDIERVLQTHFAIVSLASLALSTLVGRRWLALALGVPAFMLQHAFQGWYPSLPVFRRIGFRTSKEIAEERFALKALRGDFNDALQSGDADDVLRAVKS